MKDNPNVKPVTFDLGGANETITVSPGSIESTVDRADVEDDKWNVAWDAVESLLLAMATAGVPMDTPEMRKAVAVTNDFIINTFGED